MNDVDAELERVVSRSVSYIVTELIFFLVAHRRKSSDGRGKLIVPVGLEAGGGQGGGTKRKCESEAQS